MTEDDTRTLTTSMRTLLHRLKHEHHALEGRLKSVQQQISKDTAAAATAAKEGNDGRHMPRTAAQPWFVARGLPVPCTIVQFWDTFFQTIVAEHRADPNQRTLLLHEEEARLFRLHPHTRYAWSEVIERITNVFHLEM